MAFAVVIGHARTIVERNAFLISRDGRQALGSELLDNVAPPWLWVAKNVERFQNGRDALENR